MDENALLFFQQDIEALPLYERLEGLILDRIADVQIKVQKSQISFYNRHMFACVSFSKVRKAKDRPAHYNLCRSDHEELPHNRAPGHSPKIQSA